MENVVLYCNHLKVQMTMKVDDDVDASLLLLDENNRGADRNCRDDDDCILDFAMT